MEMGPTPEPVVKNELGEQNSNQNKVKTSQVSKIIIISFIVLVILGIVGYFYLSNYKTPKINLSTSSASINPTQIIPFPTSYWKLDEGSGNRVDSIGKNHLINNGDVVSGVGKFGSASEFIPNSGTGQFLSIPDNATLSTGDISFTISAWVNADDLTSSNGATFPLRVIAEKRQNSTPNNTEWMLLYDGNVGVEKFRFYTYNSAGVTIGDVSASTPTPIATSTWYYVVAWRDKVNDTVNIQVNNEVIYSQSENLSSGSTSDTGVDFRIGGAGWGPVNWSGKIDEVGFWKTVLSDSQRSQLFNSGLDTNQYQSTGGQITNHPKYFAYWGGADDVTADHVNTIFVPASKVSWARGLGLKAIVHIPSHWDAQYGVPWHHPDYFNPASADYHFWADWVKALQPNIDNVAAIFLVDEPSHSNDWSVIKSDLERATSEIKKEFPNTPVYVNFLAPDARGFAFGPMPVNVDWVSFDCYGAWDNCSDLGYSIPQELYALKQQMNSGQKIILVSSAFRASVPVWNLSDSELSLLADKYLNLAQTDPDIIGVFPFLWQTIADPSGYTLTGVKDLPILQQKYKQIGATILANAPDIMPPTISNLSIKVINRTPNSATITWKTNEPATTQLIYGDTPSLVFSSNLDSNYVLDHSVVLTGLNPQQQYYYQLISQDSKQNIGKFFSQYGNLSFMTTATYPTVTFSASPTQITSGLSSTLTWSSTDSQRCAGSGDWTGTNKNTSGTELVYPTKTSTYVITCFKTYNTGYMTAETVSQSATTTVTVSTPTQTNKFSIGDRVRTTTNLKVRSSPNLLSLSFCSQQRNAYGKVIEGPQKNSNNTLWKIDFDSSCDGWVTESYLTK